jgi:hypothetical protein
MNSLDVEPEFLLLFSSKMYIRLKGLSHYIFRVVFWNEWIYLGLNRNLFWFLNFKDAPLI